jgi:hypothetical protein
MRKVFTGLAGLLMLAVVVQFYLAGVGAFDSAPTEEAFRPHRSLGYVIVILSLVLVLFAAIAGMGGKMIGMSGLVLGLTILQPVIAILANSFGDSADETTTAGRLVFGLHAINALIIMMVLRQVITQSRAVAAAPAPAETAKVS